MKGYESSVISVLFSIEPISNNARIEKNTSEDYGGEIFSKKVCSTTHTRHKFYNRGIYVDEI